jgi:hypothetical protein
MIHAIKGEFDIGKYSRIGEGGDCSVNHSSAVKISPSIDHTRLFAHDVEIAIVDKELELAVGFVGFRCPELDLVLLDATLRLVISSSPLNLGELLGEGDL